VATDTDPGSPAPPDSGSALLDGRLRALESWLQAITQNTGAAADCLRRTESLLLNGSGTGTPGPAPDRGESDKIATRWERASDALGRRFEGALARWNRTPVETIINGALDRSTQALGNIISGSLNQARGLAQRGLSGTVEQARLDYSMEQLSRQFAAILMPLTNGLTYFTARLTDMMAGLKGSQQNRLLGAGLGAVVGGRVGGPMGALVGGGIGAMALGAPSENDRWLGAGAGLAIGARLAGPIGAAIGAPIGYAVGSGDYGRRREMGDSRFGAGARAAGVALLDTGEAPAMKVLRSALGISSPADMARDGMGIRPGALAAGAAAAAARPDPRRDVTPFQAEMGDPGAAYFRAQVGAIRATAGADFEDAGPLKPVLDMMLEIIKILARIAGVEVRDPRSSEAAR
jgi:hypothetical protein